MYFLDIAATSRDGVFFEKLIPAQPVNKFPAIMVPKTLLPFLQIHTTESCPEPDETNFHPDTLTSERNCTKQQHSNAVTLHHVGPSTTGTALFLVFLFYLRKTEIFPTRELNNTASNVLLVR
jgi:hypothetical protein